MAAFAVAGFLSSVLGVGVRFLVAMRFSLGRCRVPLQVKSLRTEPLPFHHPRWLILTHQGGIAIQEE